MNRHCDAEALRGFTLIEIVVVLLIVGLIGSMAAAISKTLVIKQQYSTTRARLATLDAALVNYVAVMKRLPCPADGTVAQGAVGAGAEAGAPGTCLNSQQTGVVPWASLGLTEDDATDGWGRRFTYRVPPNLTSVGAMNLSDCDPAPGAVGPLVGGTCFSPCTSTPAGALASCTQPSLYLCGRGLTIQSLSSALLADPNPTLCGTANLPTGAAYIVISNGDNGGGAYLSTGVLQPLTGVEGNGERQNVNSQTIGGQPLGAYYVDDGISAVPHFADIVMRASVQSVATRAGLGPRSHP